MPRYFFQVQDGSGYVDRQGTELADMEAARREAFRFAGALLMESTEPFWGSREWKMRVTDTAGLTLFELMVLITDAPSSGRLGTLFGSS